MRELDAQGHIEVMLQDGQPFEELEAFIDNLSLPQDEADALWLYAWSASREPVPLQGLTLPAPRLRAVS